MPKRVPLPPALLGVAIRTSAAADYGLGPGRLRSSDFEHPFGGVSTVDISLDSVIAACTAFEPVLRSSNFYSHSTAAALYGAPLPPTMDVLPLHISAIGVRVQPRRRSVTGHVLSAASVRLIRGFPVTSPADTWFLLSRQLSLDDLVAAGDYFVTGIRRRDGTRAQPLCTIDELKAVVKANAGRRGAAVAARALRWIRSGADSRMETLLRLLIVRAALAEPVMQHPVAVGGGRVLHPDLAYPGLFLAIEYEGDGHRTDVKQFRSDILRRERFEVAGWRLVRVTADDVTGNPAAFVARLRSILDRRAREIAVLAPTRDF